MLKYTRMYVIRALFLFITFSILCIQGPYSAEIVHTYDENVERKWRQSLDIFDHTGEKIVHQVESWLSSTFTAINPDNEKSIRSKCEKASPVEQNIAAARFTIIARVKEHIHFFDYDLAKIFVSGLNALDRNNKEVIEQKLLDKIIFPISFIEGARPNGGEIDKRLRLKVDTILGKNVVEAGTHSEESIIITIDNNLHTFITTAAKGQPMMIIGTILEISSFKDPCSDVCVPMLKAFMENVHIVLNSKHVEHVKVAAKLENLVLLSGRKSHNSKKNVDSRAGMTIVNDKIKLNFEAPSNGIFSKKSD